MVKAMSHSTPTAKGDTMTYDEMMAPDRIADLHGLDDGMRKWLHGLYSMLARNDYESMVTGFEAGLQYANRKREEPITVEFAAPGPGAITDLGAEIVKAIEGAKANGTARLTKAAAESIPGAPGISDVSLVTPRADERMAECDACTFGPDACDVHREEYAAVEVPKKAALDAYRKACGVPTR
jgi:hypothetical protein